MPGAGHRIALEQGPPLAKLGLKQEIVQTGYGRVALLDCRQEADRAGEVTGADGVWRPRAREPQR